MKRILCLHLVQFSSASAYLFCPRLFLHDPVGLELNNIHEITLDDQLIVITFLPPNGIICTEEILFKYAPVPPHILQAISDNLSLLITEAKTIYEKYSKHNIKLHFHHPSNGYELFLL